MISNNTYMVQIEINKKVIADSTIKQYGSCSVASIVLLLVGVPRSKSNFFLFPTKRNEMKTNLRY